VSLSHELRLGTWAWFVVRERGDRRGVDEPGDRGENGVACKDGAAVRCLLA
jgi:hypothetical protein